MISKAFAALVARTAVGEYSLSPQSGLLEPGFSLNQAEIDRLVEAAMCSYGYPSRKAAMTDIFELSAVTSLQYGDSAASVNMLRCASGDILRFTDAAGSSMHLLCTAPARMLVMSDSSAALACGDMLRPLTPLVAVGDRAIFAVERDGFPYPSDSRYYRFGPVGKIEIAPNDASDIFAGAEYDGRTVPHMESTTVYASHGNHGARGFDAEDFVTDSADALFRIDFSSGGRVTYSLNPGFNINYNGLAPDERRATHDMYVAEVSRMCTLSAPGEPLHRLVTLVPGILSVIRRPDGFATLAIEQRAEIGIKH